MGKTKNRKRSKMLRQRKKERDNEKISQEISIQGLSKVKKKLN